MEQIYTIPVNEAFEAGAADPSCGCPICALYRKLEEDELDLILGASMMEPDVRIRTNELGFCKIHYDMMFRRKNRLGMALTLESHLNDLREETEIGGGLANLLGNVASKPLSRIEKLETEVSRLRSGIPVPAVEQPRVAPVKKEEPVTAPEKKADVAPEGKRDVKKQECS